MQTERGVTINCVGIYIPFVLTFSRFVAQIHAMSGQDHINAAQNYAGNTQQHLRARHQFKLTPWERRRNRPSVVLHPHLANVFRELQLYNL